MTDWGMVFDDSEPAAPQPSEIRAQLALTLLAPLSSEEVRKQREFYDQQVRRSPGVPDAPMDPDPSMWVMPKAPLPADWLSFLDWCDGGAFRTGERYFQMLSCSDPEHGVRAMMLAYALPMFMPGALPFALNGGGVFYLFDLRSCAEVRSRAPVVCTPAGAPGWRKGEHGVVAPSFADCLGGRTNIESLL